MLVLVLSGLVAAAAGQSLQPGPNPNCPAPWTQTSGADSCFDCCNWARLGQCDSNPNWMRPYCQESCGTTGCAVGSASSCTVKVKSICSGSSASTGTPAAGTPAASTAAASSPGQQIILNILLTSNGTSSPAANSTAKPTTTAAPAAAGMGGATLYIIPLNLTALSGSTGANGTSANSSTTTTTTTAKPATLNLANLPIYVLQLNASSLPGLSAAAASATTTTTAAPGSAGSISLANLNLANLPVFLLTPRQRRARALRRLQAKRRRATALRKARRNNN